MQILNYILIVSVTIFVNLLSVAVIMAIVEHCKPEIPEDQEVPYE